MQIISGGTDWKQVSAGTHMAAIKNDGTLWTWGRNSYGKLGDNSIINRSSPVQTIVGGTDWKQVFCGGTHTAAIKIDGTLWCWGYNIFGQLGDNTIIARSSPVQTIAFGTDWKQVSCGEGHTAAIKNDGTLWNWGFNFDGELGDNSTVWKSSPVQTIAGGTNWNQISCGSNHTAAIKNDGTLWSWGQNDYAQLGDNTTVNKLSPVQIISGGTNWKKVDCGNVLTAAIKNDGTLWAWGGNYNGALGDGTTIDKSSPVQTITNGNNWLDVSVGTFVAGIKSS